MAAIDKIYLDSYTEYKEFQKWLLEQPKLKDKYGKEVSIYSYFFTWWDDPKEWKDSGHPVFSAPYYVDAYVIRNCPLECVQEDLMLNYGYWSQERIKEFYNDVKNWEGEGECPYLAKLEDFITLEDETMTIKGLEKSSYEQIKDGELFNSPTRKGTYEVGKHFKILKLPYYQHKCNYPMPYRNNRNVKRQPKWDVSVSIFGMWWHERNKIGTWDFRGEFVNASRSSSSTWCPSLKAIKRRILKWKLPVGTIVTLQGMYVGEDYKILIKK